MTIRLQSLRGHNVGPFTDLDIDFEAIPGTVIAVVGEIGAGKSTLLTLATGGLLYRKCEGLGPIMKLVTGPDAWIEGKIVNRQSWTIRHDLVGKGESLALDANGTPAFEGKGVSRFDEWSEKELPLSKLLYASTIAPQKTRGFIDLTEGERLALLLRAIGADELERQAKVGRDDASAADKKILVAEARLADERKRSGLGVDVAAKALDESSQRVSSTTADALEVADDLRLARIHADRVSAANADLARRRRERVDLEEVVRAAAAKLADLGTRLTNNRALLGKADDVRAAEARAAEIDRAIAALRVEVVERRTTKEGHEQDGRRQMEVSCQHGDRAVTAWDRMRAAKAKLGRREEIEKAVADVERLTGELAIAEKAASDAHDVVRELGSRQLLSAEGRIGKLRGALVFIRDEGSAGVVVHHDRAVDIGEFAKDTIDDDDHAVDTARELPGELARAKVAARQADLVLAGVRSSIDRARSVAALASTLDAAAEEHAAAERDAREHEKASKEAEQRALDAKARQETAFLELGTVHARLTEAERERETLKPLLAQASQLAQAETRIGELEPQRAEAEVAHDAAISRLRAAIAQPLGEPSLLPDLVSLEGKARAADESVNAAKTALALSEKALHSAKESAARMEELEAELAVDREAFADCTRFASDVDEIKLLEVDSAGPKLTQLANKLLHTSVGPRFTLQIETQRPDAKGKKMVDGVAVTIIDSGPKPRTGPAESCSPGERAILNEAIAIALAIESCGKAGVTGASLVRDETGSSLSLKMGPAYVEMLRLALAMGGFSKVFFVTHSPGCIEKADSLILVENGCATVKEAA